MPHANEAFSVEDTLTDAAPVAARIHAPSREALRQQESETPNERAMRAATAARKTIEPSKRQHS